MADIPKAFISYSHDSQDHKKWVLDFATRLRNAGVDAILDQWELRPGDDLPHFMERHLAAADRVLMVCTENYVKKANAGVDAILDQWELRPGDDLPHFMERHLAAADR